MARFVPVEEEETREGQASFTPSEEPADEAPATEPAPAETAVSDRIGPFGRSEFAATGGTIGAAVGTAAGPAGTVAGGALGAAIGSGVFDNAHNLLAAVQGRPEDIRGFSEVARAGMGEGAMDAAFGMAGALAQPLRFARAGLAKISGVTTDAAQDLIQKARHLGIALGAVDVGTTVPKTYARSVGVFPLTGTPMRKGQMTKLQQTNQAINQTLDAFAPNERIAADIGVDMFEAARGARQEFRTVAGRLYNNVRDAIKSAERSDIIPTGTLREHAKSVVDIARQGEIVLANGETLPRAQRQEVAEFMERLQGLPEFITPDQYKRLSDDLGDMISTNIRDGFDVKQLSDAKLALREDFSNIRTDLLPENQGKEIQDSLNAANTFYAKGIVDFQTRASQAFERVDRMIFKAGAPEPGSLNADELYRVAINLRSPQQIRDLTRLVGRGNIRNAARRNFQDAVDTARSEVDIMGQPYAVVNPEKLERSLGLAGARGDRLEGLREFYKTAGVDLEQVQNLISVMKRIEGVGNPSEFVRRRVILGGAAAATGALGVGAATATADMSGGALTAVGMTVLARHFSKIFADPNKLKAMTGALDEAAKASSRRAQMGRVFKLLMEEEEEQGDMTLPVSP